MMSAHVIVSETVRGLNASHVSKKAEIRRSFITTTGREGHTTRALQDGDQGDKFYGPVLVS